LSGAMKRRDPGHGCQPHDDKCRYSPHRHYRWGFAWLAVPARGNSPWWFHVSTVRRQRNQPMDQWFCSAAISLAVSSVLGLVSPGGVASDDRT
jgi:hypothetical protein